MKRMNKQRRELAVELLHEAKKRVPTKYDNVGTLNKDGAVYSRGLCQALADSASYLDGKKVASSNQIDEVYQRLTDLISARLGIYMFLEGWLKWQGFGDGQPCDKAQKARHRWIDSLIKEHS